MTNVSVQDRDGVALVTIDRPPANALSPDLLDEGIAVAERLRIEAPAAVVLSGRPGYFSAGMDLKIAPTLDATGQQRTVAGINRLFASWYSLPCPTVAAVTGHAIAGGMILALCCDLRVVGESGRFGLTEVQVGIPYPAVALAVVQAELSPHAARRLALRADLVDASTARALGAFDEQVADDAVVERALALAHELAELPTRAYTATKLTLRHETIERASAVVAEGDPLASNWISS
jgi:enoyl-CoA hydratase